MNSNNLVDAGLQTIATALIVLGVNSIGPNLLAGAIEVVLGIAVYLVYELTPTK